MAFVANEVALCTHLAREYYDKGLGNRILKDSVALVKQALTSAYLDVEEYITTADELKNYTVRVEDEELVVHPELETLIEASTES